MIKLFGNTSIGYAVSQRELASQTVLTPTRERGRGGET
jgi:hypothetical protein